MLDFNNVKKALDKHIETKYIAGAACMVSVNGKLGFEYYNGYADIETGRKIEKNTLYRLASMTKPIAGALCLILREQGLLDLDAPLYTYIPEFKDAAVGVYEKDNSISSTAPLLRPVTLRDCLTHSSGIGQDAAVFACEAAITHLEKLTLENIAKAYATVPLASQPGKRTSYSATAAPDVAVRCCEKVTGKTLGELLKTYIFDKLGMNETTYFPNDEQWQRVAECYEPTSLKKIPLGKNNFSFQHPNYEGGGAGLISSLNDYAKFAEMLLSGGKDVMTNVSIDEMRRPQLPAYTDGLMPTHNWGILVRTLDAQNENQPLPAGCYGWSGAWGTHFWVDPVNKITAVMMMCGNVNGAGSIVARDFEKAVYM